MKGPKGTLQHTVAEPIEIARPRTAPSQVTRPNDERPNRALHGLSRTLVANMVIGVTEGYTQGARDRRRRLPRAAKGRDLEFALGFSHPVVVDGRPRASPSTSRARPGSRSSGIDKQKVGEVAANIRKLRKPDPYKGKGVRYQGEVSPPQGRKGW